jgi:hypothetical protein
MEAPRLTVARAKTGIERGRVPHPVVIELDHLAQGGQPAVVHVGRADGDFNWPPPAPVSAGIESRPLLLALSAKNAMVRWQLMQPIVVNSRSPSRSDAVKRVESGAVPVA